MEKALLPTPAIERNSHPSVLERGVVLQDRYRIVRQLGKGGMGAVYEAVDQRLDATVALKETFSVDDRLRRQFEQEARLLAHLHHPALPRVSDYFTEGNRAFLVMHFIAGADLAEIISQQPGPFPRNLVIAWADQLLDALIYLHTRDRQVVHRDIKPHNLKLTSSGQIALIDFGLAKAQPANVSTTVASASIFGYTRCYSPLEQIQNHETTPRSDIYALGATLYHLLTGVKPVDATTRAAALVNSRSDPLRPANEIHRAVGPEIASILSRALALNSEDRYASANDFRQALLQVGRKENLARESANRSIAESARDSTVNPTVVRKAHVPAFDPFDTYSILKPDEMAWPIPKHSRRLLVIALMLAGLMIAGLGTFFDFDRWIDSPESVLGYAKSTSNKDERGPVFVAKQSKPEKNRPKVSALRNVSSASLGQVNRKGDAQERRKGRSNDSRARPPAFALPPLAIPEMK